MSRHQTASLLASGELEVVAVASDGSRGATRLDDALARAFAQLRELSARANVARLGRDQGYRIEDVVHVEARGL
ncbi:MAG: hypothetical protein JWP87_5551, partial [Labilithrix sp.]|nr:hypothetical protein [Labilithrix sp.]